MSREVITVINLLRRPDRKASFLKRNQAAHVDFQFVEAVDGQQLDIDQVRQSGLLAEDAKMAPGHLACAISHYNCLKQVIVSGQPGIIAEDDAVFRHDFVEQWQRIKTSLPTDWDIVLFGFNLDSFLMVELLPGQDAYHGFIQAPVTDETISDFQSLTRPVALCPLKNAFGTMAYAITPKGARRFINYCYPLHNTELHIPVTGKTIRSYTVDCLLNLYFAKWTSFVTVPPLVMTKHDRKGSDTQGDL